MGFFSSLFGRKKNRNQGDTTPVPEAASGPSARELARLTAEKIDEIESQMVQEGGSVAHPALHAATARAPEKVAEAAKAEAVAVPAAGGNTEINGRASVLARPREGAIEIRSSGLLPVLEEVSVLFANGQVAEATQNLKQAIDQKQLGDHDRLGWKMLLELYQASGQRAEFENLAMEYASLFLLSPPAWVDELVLATEDDSPAMLSSTVLFPPVIDAQVVKQTEQMTRAIQRKRQLRVDFSRVTSIDMIGADLLLRTFRDFRKARHELTICGVEALEKALSSMTESGRRDPDEYCWQLRLMALRMLGRQQDFEDLAIDYCVTYEVSPPSWEALPDSMKVVLADSGKQEQEPETQQPYVGEMFVLAGVLTGRAESMFRRLRAWAEDRREVTLDCRQLVRIDFACASELLNEVVALQAHGKPVTIRQPSYLVAYLMIVMGLGDLVELQLRHA